MFGWVERFDTEGTPVPMGLYQQAALHVVAGWGREVHPLKPLYSGCNGNAPPHTQLPCPAYSSGLYLSHR